MDRKELTRLANLALPGPWELVFPLHDDCPWVSGPIKAANGPWFLSVTRLTEEWTQQHADTIKYVLCANPSAILDLLAQLEAKEAEIAELRKQVEESEFALTTTIWDRDHAQDALLEASEVMGGPEWCAKIPPEEPPNSGDLHDDVPELCRQLVEECDALRASRDADIERAIRLTIVQCDQHEAGVRWRSGNAILAAVIAQMKEPTNG